MPTLIPARPRAPGAGRTVKFEGAAYGAQLSFFAVDSDPGQSVGLHVHPYTEIWMIEAGTVRFTTRDGDYDAGPGDIMIVEPETPHGFTVTGTVPARMMCLHDSAEIIQTFLGD